MPMVPCFSWLFVAFTFLVSACLKLYNIHHPDIICWDELHYAKMSTLYITRNFFFDVHPPLGKILLALCAVLSGYKGDSTFEKTCEPYHENYPYIELRVFCSLLSSLQPVFCLCIVWNMTASFRASLITVVLVLFDTGLMLMGRLILLDSMLMFFMFSSFSSFVKSQQYEILSKWNIIWLLLTGTCLGFEISTKMTGIFTMLFYITKFLYQVWSILPIKAYSLSTMLKHCGINIFCLMIIPTCLYITVFQVHFSLLTKSGPGDALFSVSVQSQLRGNIFNNLALPKYVTYNSDVTLRNIGKKAYLNHPRNSYCQELNTLVTTSASLDENSFWKFRTVLYDGFEIEAIKYVSDGDVVQLQHSRSMEMLGSIYSSSIDDIDVMCTNKNDSVDTAENHYYRIILDTAQMIGFDLNTASDKQQFSNSEERTTLRPMKQAFYIKDVDNDCFLQSMDGHHWLLQWHYGVTCSARSDSQNALWYIELSRDEKVEKMELHIQPLSLWQMFMEVHSVMLKAHSMLEAKNDATNSFPWQWPFNIPGQPIAGPEYIIYLIGTPIIWWMSLAILITFVVTGLIVSIFEQRNSSPVLTGEELHLMSCCRWIFTSWFFHFFPFFLMNRVLYFHHYLPAATFKFMLAGIGLHCVLKIAEDYFIHPVISFSFTTAMFAMILQNFRTFSSLSYGLNMTEENSENVLSNLRWIRYWNF